NVTHDVVTPEDFNGSRNVVRNVLAAFDAAAAVRWFASLGVELKREETGKLFPVADTARAVLKALLDRCEELGVGVRGASRVGRITPPTADAPFVIEHQHGVLHTARLILCTSGRALPRSRSDAAAWEIARP